MREVARIALLVLTWAAIAAAADQPHPFLQDSPPAIIGNPAADTTLPPRLGRPGHLLLACSTRIAREPEKAEVYASAADFDEGGERLCLKRIAQAGRGVL